MKEQLIHILDQSVCLSRKQMKEYLSGTMLPEEAHAAEVHLSSCPLCSLAMEGFEAHSEEALQAIASLNSGFLKEHFDNISPQIHLNSMAPAAAMPATQGGRKGNTRALPVWRTGSIAAGIVLIFALLWAFKRFNSSEIAHEQSKAGGGSSVVTNVRPDNAGSANAQQELINEADQPQQASAPAAIPSKPEPGTSGSSPAVKTVTATQAGAGTIASASAAPAVVVPSAGSANEPIPGIENLKVPQDKKEYRAYDETIDVQTNAEDEHKAGTGTKAKASAVPPKPEAASDAESARRDESYAKRALETALEQHRKGMNSPDPRTRYSSMIMAAESYAALGNTKKAEQLLKQVIDNGAGPERRAARRALRRLK